MLKSPAFGNTRTVSSHNMDTLKAQADNKRLFWTLPCIIVLVGLFFAFAGLSEFYHVGVAGETGAYPWGSVNEVPWYYQTPNIYSTYNLASGLSFLAATLLTLWATLKKNKTLAVAGISLTMLFLFIEWLH